MREVVRADVAAIVADPVIAAAFDTAAGGRSSQDLAGDTIVIAGAGGLIARYTAFTLAELAAEHHLGATVVCLVRDRARA